MVFAADDHMVKESDLEEIAKLRELRRHVDVVAGWLKAV